MRFLRKTHYFRIALYSNLQFKFLCEEVFWEKFDFNASPYFRVKTVVFPQNLATRVVIEMQTTWIAFEKANKPFSKVENRNYNSSKIQRKLYFFSKQQNIKKKSSAGNRW